MESNRFPLEFVERELGQEEPLLLLVNVWPRLRTSVSPSAQHTSQESSSNPTSRNHSEIALHQTKTSGGGGQI